MIQNCNIYQLVRDVISITNNQSKICPFCHLNGSNTFLHLYWLCKEVRRPLNFACHNKTDYRENITFLELQERIESLF